MTTSPLINMLLMTLVFSVMRFGFNESDATACFFALAYPLADLSAVGAAMVRGVSIEKKR